MADGYLDTVMDLMSTRLIGVDGVSEVIMRSLNPADAHGMLGISGDDWAPIDFEMGGPFPSEPTTQRYNISLQHLVKWGVEQEGLKIHREVAKAIRLMLYRDPDFQVSLLKLFVQEDLRRERTQRFFITNQRYAQNQAGKVFLFMSVTNLAVETEVVTTS